MSLFLQWGRVLFVFAVGASGLGSALILLVFCFPFGIFMVICCGLFGSFVWTSVTFSLSSSCLFFVCLRFLASSFFLSSRSLPHVRLGLSLRFVLSPSGLLSFLPVWPHSFHMSGLAPSVGVSPSI